MERFDKRALEFLHESNAIEGITAIDYTLLANCQPGRGHAGAFLDSQELARKRQPLEVEELCRWQRMIAEEQLQFGVEMPLQGVGKLRSIEVPYQVRVGEHIAPSFAEVPGKVEALVTELNQRLKPLSRYVNAPLTVELVGDFFQRFEAIHPFVDGNGRTGRLLANYIVAYCGYPIFVFRASERSSFYPAHRSKLAMRCFMADKIRECVFTLDGRLLERTAHHGAADSYAKDRQTVLVEWHELLSAQEEWRMQAMKKEGLE